jgi:hypothetical protein
MLRPSQLGAAVDRRLAELVQARARRRSMILGLLPTRWLAPLLAPRVQRLRIQIVTGLIGLSTLLVGTVFWLALH